ncbi:MAG: hypothetical protein ABI623_08430 [bacterium]
MESSSDSRAALLEKIRTGIRKSDGEIKSLKKKNSRYIIIGLVASALSTIIAGTAAALGPAMALALTGQSVPGPAWKLTCGAVAICTGIATIFTGLQKQLSIAERLAKSTMCAGKLHSLEFALTVNNRETPEVAKEYELAIASYPEIIL